MAGIGKNAIWSLVIAVAALAAVPAGAQNIGDVGEDSAGNVFTFTRGADGRGTWTPGRAGGGTERRILAERYIPTIWVDPDGCEHWVMDDGFEGFMSPRLDRAGHAICGRAGR